MATPSVYVVHYTCRHWINKPDPNKFGKCSIACKSLDEAEQKVVSLKSKGHAALVIEKIAVPSINRRESD